MGIMRKKNGYAITILKFLLTAGAIAVAATNPRFGPMLLRGYMREKERQKRKIENAIKFSGAFCYLRREGLIHSRYVGRQMYFSLTDKGRKLAGEYRIVDKLKIKKQKKWDRKWRLLIFDIADKQKIKREALRGKLKELGFFQLQKSVWVCPYESKKQIILLRDFFDLASADMKIIIATEIENDGELKEFFGLKS